MKIQLETIPVWDGIKSNSECYICDLMGEAQRYAISFYLGSSVMNPETRVRVNEHGFCYKHSQMLVTAQNSQGVALMADTYLAMSREKFEHSFNELLGAKSARQAKKAIEHFSEDLKKREKDASSVLRCSIACCVTTTPPHISGERTTLSGRPFPKARDSACIISKDCCNNHKRPFPPLSSLSLSAPSPSWN